MTVTIWSIRIADNNGSYTMYEYYATETEADAAARDLEDMGYHVIEVFSEEVEFDHD